MAESGRRPSVFSSTLDKLGRQIVSGSFGADGAIPAEQKLCEQLGASRGVVREVLRVLSEKGLLTAQPKVGIRVQPESKWNVMDTDVLDWLWDYGSRIDYLREFLEFRMAVEPAAAYAAALNRTDEESQQITELCDRLYEESERIMDRASDERSQDVDLQFHMSIFRASRNRMLIYVGNMIGHIMRQQIAVTTSAPGAFRTGLPLHRAIAEAIGKRDGEGAARATEENVRLTQSLLQKASQFHS
ncbi:FadR/GntR family transcriptional regulator [Aureimonas populi]|uniref:FadR/GntR family transcriptional regulator n=1 Tax=Aureimonas populi TaxID=1701758 RepID=A0ABW5CN26_9HYPH|nr:FadR/GntR family transcriptional regulator [Aureimonas populi]